MPQINLAQTPADIKAVSALFLEYLETLRVEFDNAIGCASGQQGMQGFPQAYTALLLAHVDDKPVAACGLKRISKTDCELGKLFCRPSARGHGLGRGLTQASIDHARALGCTRLVLSTEPVMKHAAALYTSMGFFDVESYSCGDGGCSKFMGFAL